MECSDAHERAYTTVKVAITSRPILHFPDHTRLFVLRTDASEVGIAAVLMQRFGNRLFSITYISKKLSDRDKRFSTIERECLALVLSVKELRMFCMAGSLRFKRTIDLFHSSIKPSMRTIGSCGGLCTCRGTHSGSTRARATQQGDMTAGKNGEDRSTPALLLKGAYVTFLPTHLYG